MSTGQQEIPATLVKQLRDETGAGMMECKRALVELGGDVAESKRILRQRGLAQAGKRAERATTEGLVGTIVGDGVGSIVGIGCESQPVSETGEFQAFGEKVLRALHADGPDALAAFE